MRASLSGQEVVFPKQRAKQTKASNLLIKITELYRPSKVSLQ